MPRDQVFLYLVDAAGYMCQLRLEVAQGRQKRLQSSFADTLELKHQKPDQDAARADKLHFQRLVDAGDVHAAVLGEAPFRALHDLVRLHVEVPGEPDIDVAVLGPYHRVGAIPAKWKDSRPASRARARSRSCST